ncbi:MULTISPECIES: tRNA (guanosine(18)-2'-O)-methyltransferase TrmH [Idiomarina]|jgi:tRNA (guanosine-2'-O-)-methyltransferase|uniref:tRNA (guanosine(18)-2'-O)-methyltransferase n=2 Tax=Idiomarina baltica TaxID=190892 RepID=A0A348WNQ5_9GAMM|nr:MULTISPECIES: tRNA (guanosine(18)-2'-O)-methyltransferase TrmH [Idiomarina]MBL73228.1 tRNA (guanosine(18)-2'-O)-methyltransferase TrmH [Idiomarinaceae bacterium]MEC8926618.1 tRNA (guanosine(18)-2'-O)-methyltransferase TrmH [Pseudomonadota bacterium]HAE91020.1 tRNA (guanosine(18)-2'-O)-methyltransferase TrmH [Idiomarina sp.]EAQ32269.1 rRNA methylase SpoU [Idiomarina baltica OS145]KXS35158.1 MAG: tRNA guanosine-2'-O-methyltransferase [Idiomarina sp. T82-3]|tara:strand:- start:2578 stop:3270 length:693 start_codon:yes stop_codon:yes gene_type:complete
MSPERYQRITEMLAFRQPDLTVVMEGVHKHHNLSAVVRTADAVGVHEMHAIWLSSKMRVSGGTALGSQNWVNVHHHSQLSPAVEQIKQQGMQVVVTHLSDQAVDFREIDYTQPTAILLGQEKHGATEEALKIADHHVKIPMVGMVQSLNVSVAGAVMLYEAQRQREQAGMYDAMRLSDTEQHRVLFEGGHPIYAKACKRKGLPYPPLDEHGQIVADNEWWLAMRAAKKRA